ncbi:MAG TPA: hypothetical protein VHA82_14925 [Ramlibacter sp.]|uniref:hypothetical protein n=1 Tax=Ramlibacter sp. TaxID=1917967 RepID=UPI002BCA4B30|nr:hypothetical protein [Ramlibacter sp.]HVZ45102.1 hypothetical protein [Ramlibacter sp.]
MNAWRAADKLATQAEARVSAMFDAHFKDGHPEPSAEVQAHAKALRRKTDDLLISVLRASRVDEQTPPQG